MKAGYFFWLFLGFFTFSALARELDPEKDLPAKVSPEESVLYDTLPVNNHPLPVNEGKRDIKSIPFPVHDPSADAIKVIDSYRNMYRRRDGKVGDIFVPYDKSVEYVLSRPNGNSENVNQETVDKAKTNFMEEKTADDYNNEIIDGYFTMRRRILAPTMKR